MSRKTTTCARTIETISHLCSVLSMGRPVRFRVALTSTPAAAAYVLEVNAAVLAEIRASAVLTCVRSMQHQRRLLSRHALQILEQRRARTVNVHAEVLTRALMQPQRQFLQLDHPVR